MCVSNGCIAGVCVFQSKRQEALRRAEREVKGSSRPRNTGFYAFGSGTSRMVGSIDQTKRAASHSTLLRGAGRFHAYDNTKDSASGAVASGNQRRAASACNLSVAPGTSHRGKNSGTLKHGTYNACCRMFLSLFDVTLSCSIHVLLPRTIM